jgi:hypothetical protein
MSNKTIQVSEEVLAKLYWAFPDSMINRNGEFIANGPANASFILYDCETELDVKCKVLEWLSRPTYKSEHFDSYIENEHLHETMLNGINVYLGTSFSFEDMETIYTYLGNRCNHPRTLRFIESGYNLSMLEEDYNGTP